VHLCSTDITLCGKGFCSVIICISSLVECGPSGNKCGFGIGVDVRSGGGGVEGGVTSALGESFPPIRIDFPRR